MPRRHKRRRSQSAADARARLGKDAPAKASPGEISALQLRLRDAISRGDKTAEIDALLEIARVSMDSGDPGLANMHFDLAAKVIGRSGVAKNRLHEALGGRALMFRRAKRYDQALELYEKAAMAAKEHATEQDAAHWIGRQGPVLREMGETERAREIVTRARDLYLALGKAGLAGLAEQEGVLGLLALDAQDEDAANSAYRRAVEFAEKSRDPGALATWGRNLANLLTRRRRYRESWRWYRKALDAMAASKQPDRFVECAFAWSSSCTLAHRHAEAAEALAAAARRVADRAERARFLDDALQSWGRAGEWRQVVKSAPALLKLLKELHAAPEHTQRIARLAEQAKANCRP
jgi:tetratricopeptide (TPR) repeat protein